METSEQGMGYFTVRPTRMDRDVARYVSRHSNRRVEDVAGAVTWAADEHVLMVAATAAWLLTRRTFSGWQHMCSHALRPAVKDVIPATA
jgi:hypothetical protein